MQRVMDSTGSFAYLPNFSDYSAAVGDVGLVAKIDECEFMHDGRCNMQVASLDRLCSSP